MAVFSAIATAVGGYLAMIGGGFLGSTLIGTAIATATGYIVAGGLAVATARALGVFDMPDMPDDPGVTIQLPPSTDNKLPVLYGNAFTSGPIFDAAISNQNQTMTYCIALSEETQTGTFSCSKIFMADDELIFSGNTVTSHRNANQSTSTNYNGKVRVNIYQGGSSGSDVIFPASGTGSSTAATAIVPHWGVNHTANNMVFAVVQMDYDAENGLAGLSPFTFQMKNSLSNPGDVLYDYATSSVYGAGISASDLDVTSITGTANTQMKGYCAEQVNYTNQANASVTHDRYEINGVISTFNPVKSNIDRICQASSTFFTYNVKKGQFSAIPNRAISSTEKANCLVYNDDNIVSKIDITSTELYNLYNAVEIEFADNTRKDQTNTVKVTTPTSDRNANEPDNELKYRLDMINDNMRAEALANIDLNQSRVGTVIQFETDFSGMQTDVGDVVKITNNLYGWTEKLFRVLRTVERQSETGMITVQMSAIEYTDDYYTLPISSESPDIGVIDLPRLPIIPPIYIPEVYAGTYSNTSALPGNVFGNVIVNDAMKTFGAGTQLTDAPGPHTLANTTTDFRDITTEESYDISGIDIGDYELTSAGNAGGTLPTTYDLGFQQKVTLSWANATASNSFVTTGGGVTFDNMTGAPPPMRAVFKVSTDPTAYGFSSDMKPTTANIVLQGYSQITSGTIGGLNYQFLRVTKGEAE